MKIYVMRHGTTVWNEKNWTQGWSQNRLSESGKKLAKQQAINFKNVKFDLIISSPLMRTMQTANFMNEYHKVKILKDKRIIEINQGVFTGRKNYTEEERKIKKRRDPSFGMESYKDAYDRTLNFLNDLKKNYKDKTILIVTHLIIGFFIESIIKNDKIGFTYYENLNEKFGNAVIKEFEIE